MAMLFATFGWVIVSLSLLATVCNLGLSVHHMLHLKHGRSANLEGNLLVLALEWLCSRRVKRCSSFASSSSRTPAPATLTGEFSLYLLSLAVTDRWCIIVVRLSLYEHAAGSCNGMLYSVESLVILMSTLRALIHLRWIR